MFASISKLFKRSERKAVVERPPAASPFKAPTRVAPTTARPAAASEAIQQTVGSDSGDTLAISVSAILKTLPEELHGNKASSGGKIFIPRKLALDQLSRGSVRIKFGELRRSAPPGVFTLSNAEDERLVELPLGELLAQLKGADLSRRTRQRVEVPDEVTNLFGSSQILSGVRVLAKEESTAMMKKSAAAPPAEPVNVPQPVAPAPDVSTAPTIPAPTATPAPTRKAAALSAIRARAAAANTAAPPPAPAVRPPLAQPKAPAPAAPAPVVAPAPAKPVVMPTVPTVRAEGKLLSVKLTDLAVKWPEAVQREIKTSSLINAMCEVPATELSKSLKQGRVEMPWKQIRKWLNPPVNSPSALGETVLQLPLEVLAPVFLGQNPTARAKKVETASDIPDLFSRATPPSPPPAPEPEPEREPEPEPVAVAPAPPPKKTSETAFRTRASLEQPASGPVEISLSLLAANWPPTLVKEIDTGFLAQAKLQIPVDALEHGMRMGKVDFLWRQLCGWLQPEAPQALVAAHAETRIELPLSVVAPLFLQRKPAQPPKKAEIKLDVSASDVPDVFQPAPTPISTVPIEGPAPTLSAPPPDGTEIRRRVKDLAELFGQPDKRNWTPNEIVQKTSALPGVAGALIALQDGLLVSSCMPPEWRTETIAAFLPQIFGRMHQYTKELKMGELESVNFAVEKGALQIFAAGIIYFAVLSKPETNLPLYELMLIAKELSRHTK